MAYEKVSSFAQKTMPSSFLHAEIVAAITKLVNTIVTKARTARCPKTSHYSPFGVAEFLLDYLIRMVSSKIIHTQINPTASFATGQQASIISKNAEDTNSAIIPISLNIVDIMAKMQKNRSGIVFHLPCWSRILQMFREPRQIKIRYRIASK